MEHGAELFRDVMSQFAAGVTLVTGMDESGVPVGFTANAVASVSLNPRLILVCVDRGSASLPVLLETGKFAVSVLRSGDGEIAPQLRSWDSRRPIQGARVRANTGWPSHTSDRIGLDELSGLAKRRSW